MIFTLFCMLAVYKIWLWIPLFGVVIGLITFFAWCRVLSTNDGDFTVADVFKSFWYWVRISTFTLFCCLIIFGCWKINAMFAVLMTIVALGVWYSVVTDEDVE